MLRLPIANAGRRLTWSSAISLFCGLLAAAATADTGIPELERWEYRMRDAGRTNCIALLRAVSSDERLSTTYYDMIRVNYQIADYTGDAGWTRCTRLARRAYRDEYILPNDGRVPAHWNFTTGLRMDYARTRNPRSRTAVMLLAQNAAYAADTTPLEWTQSAEQSREVAYAILSYINAEALGAPPRPRRADLVNQAYGHMEQWFATFAWRGTAGQFSPFLVALTAHSLIRDWEETADPRLIPVLILAADYLWVDAWVPESAGMRYQLNPDSPDGRSTTGAPDLNLLIAPIYAFLYWQTGEAKYRDQGDLLFAGGVREGWVAGGKQFNQNYWWSFDYIRWRTNGPAGSSLSGRRPWQHRSLALLAHPSSDVNSWSRPAVLQKRAALAGPPRSGGRRQAQQGQLVLVASPPSSGAPRSL